MSEYLKSSPHFFRLIKWAFALGTLAVLLLAALLPAPLEEAADLGRVPNPSKSAWFLLWMQELVSYGNAWVYLIVALAVVYTLLPWLPGLPAVRRARWFPREQRLVNVLTLLVFLTILALTLVALVFRGENWSLVWPF